MANLPSTSYLAPALMNILFTLLKISSCDVITSVPVDNTSQFKAIPCVDPGMASLLLIMEALHVTTKSNSLLCALSCDRSSLCTYAIYYDSSKSCRHLSTTKNFVPSLPDLAVSGNCIVLKRLVVVEETPDWLPQCHAVDTWKVVTKREIAALGQNAGFLQMKIFEQVSFITSIYPVQSTSFDFNGDFYVAYNYGVAKVSWRDLDFITDPLTFPLKLFVDKGKNILTADLDRKGNSIKPITSASSLTFLATRYSDDDILGRSEINVSNFLDAMQAVSSGYRRLERHPTRIEYDINDQDLHYDKTGTFVVNSVSAMAAPFDLTSVKESFRAGKRYVFRHQLYTGKTKPDLEFDASMVWRMDTCWTQLVPRYPSETMLDVLQHVVREGRDVRVIYDTLISTDAIIIQVTDKDVIFNLAPFLQPFKGFFFTKYEKRINYPVLGASGYLVGCTLKLANSAIVGRYHMVRKSTVTWFVSSRKGTQLLKYDFDKNETFGSHVMLHNAVMNGTNIRICYTDNDDRATLCFSSSQTTAILEDNILFQSPPALSIEKNQDSTLRHPTPGCPYTYNLVSSEGWVKQITINRGLDTESNHTVSVSSINYFGEM